MVMAPSFLKTLLIGRDLDRTQEVAALIGRGCVGTTDVEAVRDADVIVTVTSSESAVIQPEHLKSGAVVCDVARPRDVSVRVAEERPDVLVLEGGVVEVPGDPDFGFSFGFPAGTAYACMSETMILALENRAEPFTVGKDVTVDQVETMRSLAAKHGFRLAGFRSFEKALTDDAIARVRAAAGRPAASQTNPAPRSVKQAG
jgi:predicted amino acid dehydrogenase